MILKNLILTSFGKFEKKELQLEDGFNIIYGDNEAGKTTVHRFIEGMLFGFFKPYTKRRVYSDDYDRYFPWDKSQFRGTLKYFHEGSLYRIERNFIKGNDEVKIYDDKTGEDISYLFEYDQVTRLPQPSSLHLGFNNVVYNNTISIKQLGSKTEDDLAKEIKDTLINLGGSLDEDISVKKVIEKIDKSIDEIGTKGRIKTSPYGKITEELEGLQKEKKQSLQILNEVREHQIRLNSLLAKMEELNIRKKSLVELIESIEGIKLKERYHEAEKLIAEIGNLDRDIEELKDYCSLESLDFTEAIRLENSIKTYEESLEGLNEKLSKLASKIKRINSSFFELNQFERITNGDEVEDLSSKYISLQDKKQELNNVYEKIKELTEAIKERKEAGVSDVREDILKFEEMDDEKNKLIYSNNQGNKVLYKSKLEEGEGSLRKLVISATISTISVGAFILLGKLLGPIWYGIGVLSGGAAFYFLLSYKRTKHRIGELKEKLLTMDKEESINNQQIDALQNQMDSILKKHNCHSKVELRNKLEEYSREAILLKDNILAVEGLKIKKIELIEEIQNKEEVLRKYLNLIDLEYEITMENVKGVKAEYNRYLQIKRDLQTLQEEHKEINGEVKELDFRLKEAREKLKTIFNKNRVNGLDEFSIALEKRKKYDNALQSKDNNNSLLKKVLGDNSLEYLRKKAIEFEEKDQGDYEIEDKDELEISLDEINHNIASLREEITRTEEKVYNLSSSSRDLVDIEEEISRKSTIRDTYERKLLALEMAKETIDNLSKNIQKDFAPKLNRDISDLILDITNSKYSDVKISEDITIKINEPNRGTFIDIESLSGGTVDQLYFATRLSIIDIISNNKSFPLILDDCFIQYDENRLSKSLQFLLKKSEDRQVILFTCHKREKEILDKLGLNYNYIEL